MSDIIRVTVQVDENALKTSLESLLTEDTMLEIQNAFAKMCDPYVPFLEGPLSQTIEVDPIGVKYTQPYAHYQYMGIGFNHTLDYHPLATAQWDKAMMREHGDEFTEQVKQILLRRAKELYG